MYKLHPKHIETVVAFHCMENEEPLHEVHAIDHNANVLIYKNIKDGKKYELSIKDVNNESFFRKFSKTDIFQIGLYYSDFQHKNERDELNKICKPSLRLVK